MNTKMIFQKFLCHIVLSLRSFCLSLVIPFVWCFWAVSIIFFYLLNRCILVIVG